MYIQIWLLSVLCLAQTAFAHGGGPGIFGGPEALNALLPRVPPQHAHRREYSKRFEMEDVFTGPLLIERAEKMTCGSVNGSCPAGYWFVEISFLLETHFGENNAN